MCIEQPTPRNLEAVNDLSGIDGLVFIVGDLLETFESIPHIYGTRPSRNTVNCWRYLDISKAFGRIWGDNLSHHVSAYKLLHMDMRISEEQVNV